MNYFQSRVYIILLYTYVYVKNLQIFHPIEVMMKEVIRERRGMVELLKKKILDIEYPTVGFEPETLRFQRAHSATELSQAVL